MDAPPRERPTAALPTLPASVPTPSGESTDAPGSVIPGLASIQVLGVPYTDDGGFPYEGVAVAIMYSDANMIAINFQDVPVKVQVELYAIRSPVDLTAGEEGELVFTGEYSTDHSSPPGIHDESFRIPYDEIGADPDVHSPMGRIRVVVETPSQGTFEASMNPVPLHATFQ